MPVTRRNHEVEIARVDQLVDPVGDRVAVRHRQRAARREVVLEVDDQERTSHASIISGVREYLLTPEQAAAMDAPGHKDAAVLVPLYREPLTAVFTERRADLSRHAGEISFPGGRQDHPEEDLRETALREAEEEIGLDPAGVELMGALPPVGTFVTGYRIFPFVGLIEPGQTWRPQATEVEQVLEFTLADLVGATRCSG